MEYENEMEIQGVELDPRIVEPAPGRIFPEPEEDSQDHEIPENSNLPGPQVIFKNPPDDNKPKTLEIGEYEFDSEDIVYIFEPSKRLGIKFTSKSPKSALRIGVFETTLGSISTAEWDDAINSKEGPTLMRLRDGEITVMTYIVSEENFLRIIHDIIKQKENDRIIIDVNINGLKKDQYSDNVVNNNKLELEKFKNDLLNSVKNENPYSNNYNNEKGFWDEYNDMNKKL